MRHLLFLFFLLSLSALQTAQAESSVRFVMPESFGEYQANAYDDDGLVIGTAELSMEKHSSDGVSVTIDVRLNSGGSAVMQALLLPLPDGESLRLSRQYTWAFDDEGELVVAMQADHEQGTAQCTHRESGTQSVRLPPDERIVNVPLNLLLRPLVAGGTERVVFQSLLCEEEARIIDAEVRKIREVQTRDRGSLVETRYRLDLGPLLSLAVAPFMQKISLWFEAQPPYRWVGHRMPLYAKGPSVLVLRRGYRPQDL